MGTSLGWVFIFIFKEKIIITDSKSLFSRKRHLQRQAPVGAWDPEAHGVLCQISGFNGKLSSIAAHDGHPAAECRCRSGCHPGSFRP